MDFQVLKSEFMRNVAKLFSANVVAGLIGLAFYPVLTRLYEPADFGLLSLFTAIVGVLVILATLDLQYAIVLPADNSQSSAVSHIALISTAVVVFCSALLTFFAPQIAVIFNAPDLVSVWWLIPLMVAICAVWNIANFSLTRSGSFACISAYLIIQGSLIPLLKFLFAYFEIADYGLLYGSVVGTATAAIVVVIFSFARRGIVFHSSSRAARLQAWNSYRRFPAFSLPRSLINNLSSNIPALLLTPFFGLAPIGLFSAGITFGFRPVNMLETSIYQVFFRRVSQDYNERKPIMPVIKRFLRSVGFIIAPLAVVGIVVVSLLIEPVLGHEWAMSGIYLRYLMPWLIMTLFVAPISFLSDVFQKQPVALWLEILLIACRVGGMMVGVWADDFSIAVLGYSLGSAIAIGVQLIWYVSLVRNYDRSL